MSYYYLLASLPTLHFGDPAPLTTAAFAELCDRHLAVSDRRGLQKVWAAERAGSDLPSAERWSRSETQIRNAIVRARAERRKADPAPYLREHRGFDVSIEDAVRDAYARPTPLERERALDRLRWNLLDEEVRRDRFGLGALLAYGLQLRIAERWAALQPDLGAQRLEEFVTATLASTPDLAAAY